MIGSELMFAPVLTEGAQGRDVYFPRGADWFGLATGKEYKGGNLVGINNSMTDAIPIFIRSSTGIMRQDTTNVTKTSQLDNSFILTAGMALNLSSAAGNVYRA